MSTDPFTGRNPSYCFVELKTKELADKAMEELNGKILLGRPIKLGPGIASQRGNHKVKSDYIYPSGWRDHDTPTFNRWTRLDAADHWTGYTDDGRRLFIGGLPEMKGH